MPERSAPSGDVVFDVVFEDGLLFFELSNRSNEPVLNLRTGFERPVVGPDAVDLTRLHLFRKTSYLAPGRTISVFVDTVGSYFARRQPNFVRVELSWRQGGKPRTSRVEHDVRIYRDLPYVVGRVSTHQRRLQQTEEEAHAEPTRG